MGLLLSRVRLVFTVIRGLLLGVQPPRMLRADFGTESGGAFPLTIRWAAPATWGNDADGTGTRGYNGYYMRRGTNADGSTYTGGQTTRVNFVAQPTRFDHLMPNADRGSLWDFFIRATNKDGDHSDYAHLVVHATEQDGFLLLEHRFLRVNDGTNWRRLKLT